MTCSYETLAHYVSRETLDQISRYVTLLNTWNAKINLISKQLTAEQIYSHVLETTLVANLIKKKQSSILDVGSGNGIVGIVLTIMGFTNCTFLDTSLKKCVFLIEATKQLQLNPTVKQIDVKSYSQTNIDYIILKAVTNTKTALNITSHLISPQTHVILFKSTSQIEDEIATASKFWCFDFSKHTNPYNTNHIFLTIKNVHKRTSTYT